MDETYIENMKQAGKIAKEVRAYGASLIKSGASYMDVYNQILNKIEELGANPAFPPQIALNETAAHFLPHPGDDIIFKDELISLDIGVEYNGAIGDCALSIDLSGKHQKLLEASQKALEAAQSILKVGLPIGEIGKVIEETIAQYGFTSVKNLCGHGLGEYQIHTSPSIPNYNNEDPTTLQPGMTFAIEPFATDGAGKIYDAGNPTIFSLIEKRPVRSPASREVLKIIDSYQGCPFSIHDIIRKSKLPLFKIKFALIEMQKLHMIQGHAPLIEEKKGMVTQAENTILIDNEGVVHITTI